MEFTDTEIEHKTLVLRDAVRAINAQIISFELFRKESPRLDILLQNVTEILENHKLKRDNFNFDQFAITPSSNLSLNHLHSAQSNNSNNTITHKAEALEQNGHGSTIRHELDVSLDNYLKAIQEINLQILAFKIFSKDCISLELFIKILHSIVAKSEGASGTLPNVKLEVETSEIGINTERVIEEVGMRDKCERDRERDRDRLRVSSASTSVSAYSRITVVPSSTLLSPPHYPDRDRDRARARVQEPEPAVAEPATTIVTATVTLPVPVSVSSVSTSPELLHGVFHTSFVEPSHNHSQNAAENPQIECQQAQSNVISTETEIAEADHSTGSDDLPETERENSGNSNNSNFPDPAAVPVAGPGLGLAFDVDQTSSSSNTNVNSSSRNEGDSEEDLPLKKRKVSVSSHHLDSSTTTTTTATNTETASTSCVGPGTGPGPGPSPGSGHHAQQLHAELNARLSHHLSQPPPPQCQAAQSQKSHTCSLNVKLEPGTPSLTTPRRKFAFNLPIEPAKPQLPFREAILQIESTIDDLISSSTGGATSSSSVTSKDFIKFYCETIHVGSYKIEENTIRPEDTREQFHMFQKMFTVYMCDHGVMLSVPHLITKKLVKLIVPYNSVLSVIGEVNQDPYFSIYFRTGNKMARWIREKLGMSRHENPNYNQNKRVKVLGEPVIPWIDPYSEDLAEKSIVFILRHLTIDQKDAMQRIFGEKLQIKIH